MQYNLYLEILFLSIGVPHLPVQYPAVSLDLISLTTVGLEVKQRAIQEHRVPTYVWAVTRAVRQLLK